MGHLTLSELSAKLSPIIAKLDDNAVTEDTMVGFNRGFTPIVGDIGSEPLVAWLRWDSSLSERFIDLQTTAPKEDA